MKKKSQKSRVLKRAIERDFVTRNECLDMPYGDKITRLGAIIFDLKQEGWIFETEDNGKDCIYWLKNKPPKIEYEIVEKEGQPVVITKTIQ